MLRVGEVREELGAVEECADRNKEASTRNVTVAKIGTSVVFITVLSLRHGLIQKALFLSVRILVIVTAACM